MFERAYCTTPLCAPSRASMMTGRMPSDIGCYDNGDDFAASTPTLAHHLRAAGYHTALVGRMHFIGPDQHHGFEQRLTTDVYPADLDMVPDWRRDPAERLQWYHDADAVHTAGVSHATVQQDFDEEVAFRTLRHLDDRVRANRAAGQRIPFLMVTSFIHPAEATLRPQLTLVRGQHKLVVCPRDPDQLFDLAADPAELHNAAADPAHAQRVREMRAVLEAEYDLGALEAEILLSQDPRRLVAEALGRGAARPWDFEPDPEQRYVRGDFWDAVQRGQIRLSPECRGGGPRRARRSASW